MQIDLSDARFGQGVPHDTFAYLRRHAPVWWWEAGSCWVVTTHELVEQMNRDFTTYSSSGGIVPPDGSNINPAVLLAMDPPEHTDYRRLVIRSFVPRSIQAIEAEIRQIARDAIADFVAAGGGDFVIEVASAIPFRVMAHLTAVPRADERQIMKWGNAIAPNADPEYRPTVDAAQRANDELSEYLGRQFDERRRNPGDDLFSDLIRARFSDGRELSEADLRGFGINYLLGGTETTRNGIAQSMQTLLEHPDQAQRLQCGEVDAYTATEELLRWTTPVMHHSRWPNQTREVAGQTIRAGDRVTLWMISANRDPEAFDRPDTLDLGRNPNHHVSLGGGGPHFCLGSHLARMEIAVTFDELRPWLDKLSLAAPPQRVQSNFINGMKHLELAV